MKRRLFLSTLCLLLLTLVSCNKKEGRQIINFNEGWKFYLGDQPKASEPGYDDASWRVLDLPHDWSIEGSFSDTNKATVGGGALPGGIGWYRKAFTLDKKDSSALFFIDFDGVYRNAEVWINGHYLGKRPYGYSSFRYDLTPFLSFGAVNLIAVRVDNAAQPNSRWYSGSGIYRNVWLVKTGKVFIAHWGTHVQTPQVSNEHAKVELSSVVLNRSGAKQPFTLETEIVDPQGKVLGTAKSDIAWGNTDTAFVTQVFELNNPDLWSTDNPLLYKANSRILIGGKAVDSYETRFGLRFFNFDREKGFFLNGKPMKIMGVCDHHDLGCLGAAINTRALERQLEILKQMGCNGIRTSHNPPAPELLDLCDRMGFVVMDEAFDMWKKQKNPFDYHLDWDQWHVRDLQDMVRRDRNHPSVIIWSIGNEILEQWDTSGVAIARELAGLVHQLDSTRPITSACNDPRPFNNIIRSDALDLIGYNYHQNDFPTFLETFPKGAFIGTETTSALATRGHYDMPSDSIRRWPIRWDKPFNEGNPDNTCSSYDNCSAPWGSTHEETWKVMKKYDFLSGLFIWTGFDYLGEPTPYGWPSRSSYFGIVDLAGFPKDAYYMYQSEWTKKPVLHLFPHWNWKEGDSVDVWVYSNIPEVELYLNGSSLGTKVKGHEDLHLQWRVKYVPGEIKAVGREAGKEVLTDIRKTAGRPARIELVPDRTIIQADGQDLCFITAKIFDDQGNLVPDADNLVHFSLKGNCLMAGVDNGDPTSHASFRADSIKAFHGLCLLVVKAGKNKGNFEVMATADGLQTGAVSVAQD